MSATAIRLILLSTAFALTGCGGGGGGGMAFIPPPAVTPTPTLQLRDYREVSLGYHKTLEAAAQVAQAAREERSRGLEAT